jgi:hypothetical protein
MDANNHKPIILEMLETTIKIMLQITLELSKGKELDLVEIKISVLNLSNVLKHAKLLYFSNWIKINSSCFLSLFQNFKNQKTLKNHTLI